MRALLIGRCPKSAEQLKTFCDEVIIVLDNSFIRQRYLPELKKFTVINSKVNINTLKGIYPRSKEIVKWIKEYDLDIIFTNTKWDMVAAKFASLFVNKKILLLSTSHNSYAWVDDKKVYFMSKLIKYTTDYYVSLASFVKEKLIKNGIDKDRVLLIPNTIDSKTWIEKTDYSIKSTFRLVYVAYVCPGKCQDFIVDVLYHLKDKYDIEIDCYGDKDEFSDYVDLIESKVEKYGLKNKFRLCGRVENQDLHYLLKKYDAYFCPSSMEMSPVNILEAQAVGLPVLATNVGGIPDLIDNENTGLLFEVNNIEDASRQIIRLISDFELRERLGKNGRIYVSDFYNTSLAGDRLKLVIDKTLNNV